MTTWKKIGVKGKPVWVAEWPTFTIEIHQTPGCKEKNCRCKGQFAPFVKTRDGVHGYGIGFYSCLTAAQAEADKAGVKLAEREAGRVVNRSNPEAILGMVGKAGNKRWGF